MRFGLSNGVVGNSQFGAFGIIPRLVTLILILATVAFADHEATNATWKVVGGSDPFTDEEYYLVIPSLPVERPTSNSDYSETYLDYSYFLRPFIAVDNGTLVVGVTVYGRVVYPKYGVCSSLLPAGAVQLRIDQQAPIDIDPFKNPPLHLPGATAPLTDDSNMSDRMRRKPANSIDKAPSYSAVSGAAAESVLDQMVAGKVIKIRRTPTAELAELRENTTTLKVYQLGPNFLEALGHLGLIKDPATGHWSLDPSKESARKLIRSQSPRDKDPL